MDINCILFHVYEFHMWKYKTVYLYGYFGSDVNFITCIGSGSVQKNTENSKRKDKGETQESASWRY